MKIRFILAALFAMLALVSCGPPSSDDIQRAQQEQILAQGTSQIGMPAIKNFRERKLLKDIYELRDQASYVTYSYICAPNTGRFIYLGQSIGYPIPYSTQFTNPEKAEYVGTSGRYVLPQADPNGLFSPASANGTWVMIVDPKGEAKPQYVEDNVTCLTYKLPKEALIGYIPANY